MRKPVALLLIMGVIIALTYITKPSDEKCRAEAKRQFTQHMLNGAAGALPGNINRSVFNETLEKAFIENISVQDKVLYKEIDMQKGKDKVNIGWGAFGIVHITMQ